MDLHCPSDDTHMDWEVLIVFGNLSLGLIECPSCGHRIPFRVMTVELP